VPSADIVGPQEKLLIQLCQMHHIYTFRHRGDLSGSDPSGAVRKTRGPARTLLFTVLLGVSPFLSNGQSFGVSAGWLHGSGNQIGDLLYQTPTAEFLQPGLSVGGYVLARDSGSTFRLETGWERQAWKQKLGYRFPTSSSSVVGERHGVITTKMDLLRIAPLASLYVSRRVRVLLGAEFRILIHARTTEIASNIYSSTSAGPAPVGQWSESADSTYTSLDGFNKYQAALLVGTDVYVTESVSISGTFSAGRSLFVEAVRHPGDAIPTTLRISLNWRIR